MGEITKGTVQEQARRIFICAGSGCISSGSRQVADKLQQALDEAGLNQTVPITMTGCHGFCEQGPIVVIAPDDVFYCRVQPEDAVTLVEQHLVQGQLVESLLYRDSQTGERAKSAHDIGFYAKQQRIVLRNCGTIDPEQIDDYLAREGYQGLARALTMTPEAVIEEVKRSGLRGRGGAGFPTGLKWSFAAGAPGEKKYLVCNGDEGDPGAFMDRSLLEGDPHSVIEGMVIAAYAIGAQAGYAYIRAEYPLAIQRMQIAIDQARARGYLGESVMGTDFAFDLQIKAGAGAFVCGEETALLASIEGERGMPRVRPPYPAIKGLWGYPTNINNVETFGSVPYILRAGADAYAAVGTEKSKGTKVFALTGKVKNTGLVEVPMGLSLREIVFGIGEGIQQDRPFKAVQIGGPSGGCLPAALLDVPVDYDSLIAAGAMMGSGGLVVLDDTTCMVDLARFFLSFTQRESCGKCTPCREGTKRMLEILERITQGEGSMDDIIALERLAGVIKSTSLCGLGQTAPNPVLTTLRYFREEYEAHILEERCPAGVCKALTKFAIVPDKCVGCTACARVCPIHCISGAPKKVHTIDRSRCIGCGQCAGKCRFAAVVRA
ncbi:NADH-quinone oxidoreductase subunit NuoF [Heliophilum fasciatum]|uniref:NADH-quinone oxidoreductase subunit F/NADP-reducing hydrogenase subunit HndC n=1 Tax=Heliophilum fasciatum TaxID=35700 RepID=A0A4R2RWQ8_9FIRM|nr:NADH-quinone oxidoreductase subunit NuoF [Heliophilum fasciatum]MCW2276717.1 NADH:ubiquinone oxidoreductase subunit F (NADH-binding)/(2Fe-2S) ferredoxin/Pyruvate/2-oxoacid:ferredoxin oxidoreductase delta subunit [Heliophilum fasciatum]TCP68902.1 NADH-quinone oxidoreductase subunit F/NADP-reducing hydrogenase subunit HndC [Heliophilum fasciatum]